MVNRIQILSVQKCYDDNATRMINPVMRFCHSGYKMISRFFFCFFIINHNRKISQALLNVAAHMTLHWSPPAAGALTAGDPPLPPISPSRLRPWKAPKKESSFPGAGFLAAVVFCRHREVVTTVTRNTNVVILNSPPTFGRQWWLLKWVLWTVLSAFFLASTACWRFLWQTAQSRIRDDTWTSSLFRRQTALSSLS